MSRPRDDEFYVGYLPRAPREIASRTRWAVTSILLVGSILAPILILAQRPFATSRFEFGHVRELEGVVLEHPHPTLLVRRPGERVGVARFSQYPLLGEGKRGAAVDLQGLSNQWVRLRGTLVYRDGRTAIEVASGSVEPVAGGALLSSMLIPGPADLGTMTLVGEIVDSKCYLGVMKPATGKPHRDCATRCILGGIPPVLVVDSGGPRPAFLMLVGADGRPVNRRLARWIAEPVQITGRVVRFGELWILRADPDTFRSPPARR